MRYHCARSPLFVYCSLGKGSFGYLSICGEEGRGGEGKLVLRHVIRQEKLEERSVDYRGTSNSFLTSR